MSETLSKKLGEALRASGKTLSTAESCTGGLIASLLTDIPGSSVYLVGGVVAYSNAVKQSMLGVKLETLLAYGAVSEPVAAEMALGAQQRFGTDYAVSVTGIAGPGGGTAEKPVGLTYIGVALPDQQVVVERYVWAGDRLQNKTASAEAALQQLLNHLD